MSYEDQVASLRGEVQHLVREQDHLIRMLSNFRGEYETHTRHTQERFALVGTRIDALQPFPELPAIEATTERVGFGMGPARSWILTQPTPEKLALRINEQCIFVEAEGGTVESVTPLMRTDCWAVLIFYREAETVE